LKLTSLLLQFLVAHKRLDLPGIGSFILNGPENSMQESHKQDRPGQLENLSFESNSSIKQSPELVQFISEHSGKIKALAAADLESHLALAKQFLNIGNPFSFEGIGILEKVRSGEYALASGAGLMEKVKESSYTDKQEEGEFQNDYKKIFYSGKAKIKWKKPFIIGLVIAGLLLALWGGYTVYKRTTGKSKTVSDENKINKSPVHALVTNDTVAFHKDSVVAPVQTTFAGMQKFILETCNAKRAFERFSRLKTFQWNVQMETKDSVNFKLFMMLPASAADSSRMIDSLSRLNGKRVFIEQ
jgi:hypothetical protein